MMNENIEIIKSFIELLDKKFQELENQKHENKRLQSEIDSLRKDIKYLDRKIDSLPNSERWLI